jgi:hypothetical protein
MVKINGWELEQEHTIKPKVKGWKRLITPSRYIPKTFKKKDWKITIIKEGGVEVARIYKKGKFKTGIMTEPVLGGESWFGKTDIEKILSNPQRLIDYNKRRKLLEGHESAFMDYEIEKAVKRLKKIV